MGCSRLVGFLLDFFFVQQIDIFILNCQQLFENTFHWDPYLVLNY